MHDEDTALETAAREAVDLANRLAEADAEADPGEVADGLISGAVHYWLFSRQPCGDQACEDCAELRSAEQRLALLQALVEEVARDSEYFHTPADYGVGHA